MVEKELDKLNLHTCPPLGDGGIIYGLPYCDATKLAMQWFSKHNLPFELHDYKTQGITASALENWCAQKGWEAILNKRSTTWRSLKPDVQASVTNQENAIKVMLENTSLIKRPIIELNGKVLAVGVHEKEYQKVFLK
jgi:Spx/MgsR family transcriptional regulator